MYNCVDQGLLMVSWYSVPMMHFNQIRNGQKSLVNFKGINFFKKFFQANHTLRPYWIIIELGVKLEASGLPELMIKITCLYFTPLRLPDIFECVHPR